MGLYNYFLLYTEIQKLCRSDDYDNTFTPLQFVCL